MTVPINMRSCAKPRNSEQPVTSCLDIVVTDPSGGVAWRRLEGAMVESILRLDLLGPGERLELRDRWDQRARDGTPVPPGLYHVSGAVMTEGEPLRTPRYLLSIAAR